MKQAWPGSALLLASTVFAAPAQAEETEIGLPELLRLIPEAERTYTGGQIFSYVDFRAVEEAAGLPRVAVEDAAELGSTFVAWPSNIRDAWRANLGRVVAGQSGVLDYARQIGESPDTMLTAMGFDLFAIDKALTFWEFPEIAVLAGGSDLTSMDEMINYSALRERGYALADESGVPVWHRFDDNASALFLTDEAWLADPFDADSMRAARMAVQPGLLIATANWPDLRAVLAVQQGQAPTAEIVPLLEALVAAATSLDGISGPVLQAWAYPAEVVAITNSPIEPMLELLQTHPDPQALDLDAMLESLMPPQEGPLLPPYPMALFADLQAGDDQVNAIVLPYPDRAMAALAAKVVSLRLGNWIYPEGATDPLVTAVDGVIETRVIDAPSVGPAIAAYVHSMVQARGDGSSIPIDAESLAAEAETSGGIAVIAVRYPMPERLTSEDVGPGLVWRHWFNAIIARQLAPLAVP